MPRMIKGNSAEMLSLLNGHAESEGRSSFANQTETIGWSRFDRCAYDYSDGN
jgi:hypothetical protein